jgi:helix-turn-helix protein
LSGPLAVQHVANALSSIASSLSASDNHNISTPQCRTQAIKTVAVDQSLTQEEQIKVMQLFRKDIASADAYLAIDNMELQMTYIKDELDDF